MPAVSDPSPRQRVSSRREILRPGRNCWRVERADRFSCIQDAADYFRLVRQAILQAHDTVFIVGWDIQATLNLVPGGASDEAPTRLDELLKWVVARRPHLRCYILIWDHAALYTLERDPFTRWRLGWRMPRQVRFGFADDYPLGASHHQKIVVIDDELAFCGGVDLTGHRWDTAAHRLEEPGRVNAAGSPYGPYHEIQAMASGPLAVRLGDLARDRWRALGEAPRPPTAAVPRGLWPQDIAPDLTDVDVAIARTRPASEREPEIRECERLFFDAIAAAERSIYIESQYFTNDALGRALADRLQQRDGPEVVVVIPEVCHGWLEQQTMGALRGEVLRHLVAADHDGRLRLVYPAASRAGGVSTFVHSKVMIVDDRLLRIGSANLSCRSMAVDSECDVAADAGDEPRLREGVERIRHRLMGEHLGMPADAVAFEVARLGSLRQVVDAHAHADRTLVRVDLSGPVEPPSEIVRMAADPDAPIAPPFGTAALIPPRDAGATHGSIRVGLAYFALIPPELVAVGAGVALGGLSGVAVAIAGGLTSAIVGYAVGRAMGIMRLARWMSRRAYRSARQLIARGVIGVMMLRLTSIASAGSVHLVCGAAGVPFGAYLAGSLLGLIPVVVVLSGVGNLIRAAIINPGWSSALVAAAGVLGAFALAIAARSLLLTRRFSPSVQRQHAREEFG